MPRLREIVKIFKKKSNSDDELYLKLLMKPLSKKTKRAAKNKALQDMTDEQKKYLNPQVKEDLRDFFKPSQS